MGSVNVDHEDVLAVCGILAKQKGPMMMRRRPSTDV